MNTINQALPFRHLNVVGVNSDVQDNGIYGVAATESGQIARVEASSNVAVNKEIININDFPIALQQQLTEIAGTDLSALRMGQFIALDDLIAIKDQMQQGKLSVNDAFLKLSALFEQAISKIKCLQDSSTADQLVKSYETASDREAAKTTVANAVKSHVDNAVNEVKADLPEKANLQEIDENLNTLYADNGLLDINALIRKIMQALNELRKLANEQKVNEREATLKLELASADDTRKAGQEEMVAALISGIINIVVGVATVVAVGAVSWKAQQKGSTLEKTMQKQGGFSKYEIDKAVGDKIHMSHDKSMLYVNNTSNLGKAGGEMGAGIQQLNIADVEAKGKEHDAYAHAAANRMDTADKMAQDLLQTILKMIENFLQLQSIVNQGSSNIINKMA